MGGGRYLQSKSMRLCSLNIKTEGHLVLEVLKRGLYHFNLGDVYLDRVIIHTAKAK